jgi:transposase
VITDAHGTPSAITLTAGNRNDITQLLPLLDAVPHFKGRTGRPRHLLGQRGIKPVIAGRGTPHGSGLGAVRWVVERTNAWIRGFRRLRIRPPEP